MNNMREEADYIVSASIKAVLPDAAVAKALADHEFKKGRIVLVAAGKAAWQMANAAVSILGDRIDAGIVVTKYDHVQHEIQGIECVEAGHPVPDENSFKGTARAVELVKSLTENDEVLFLLSGGASALFEIPLIPSEEVTDLTRQLLACGADIVEMNTIRKRMSAVKGGKFALTCAPAHVYSIVLSDVLGDPLDMIASGPAYPDTSTPAQAVAIAEKYKLKLSEAAEKLLHTELPKELTNVETVITGSVRELCSAGEKACKELGYRTVVLTDQMDNEAREAGRFLSSIAKTHCGDGPIAFIAGGETVVHLKGDGKGGRNQELALSAAEGISGLDNAAVFSFGSDGTDGPTDAAGGYSDNTTFERLREKGIDFYSELENNDAYNALAAVDGLIITGPTGTNVNDMAVLLIR